MGYDKTKFMANGVMETYPNSLCRAFHLRNRVVPHGRYVCTDMSPDWSGIPTYTKTITDRLMAISGVTDVSCRQFYFTVSIGEAFTWDEMIPKIQFIMAMHLPLIKD